jgi:hypothetical protein
MSISSVGGSGSTSFWQQDQNYWAQGQSQSNTIAATDSVIGAISTAETNLGKGLASIANGAALNRVDSQLTAAIQSILSGNTGSSSSSGAASSTASATKGSPATATGTVALSLNTPLSTLGILAGGSITVSAGQNTTTYASTGSDTVGDFMNAINQDLVGNAAVTASISPQGRLVLTGKNDTDTITVGGVYASNIGFAAGNQTFKPTPPSSTSGSSSSSASSAASTSASSTTSSSAKAPKSYTTVASLVASSAASVLSDSGDGGSLVDMLA